MTKKIKFFLKLYHNLQLKVKFSLAAPEEFDNFCQISSAQLLLIAPTQLPRSSKPQLPRAAQLQLLRSSLTQLLHSRHLRRVAAAHEHLFVVCQTSDKANVLRHMSDKRMSDKGLVRPNSEHMFEKLLPPNNYTTQPLYCQVQNSLVN